MNCPRFTCGEAPPEAPRGWSAVMRRWLAEAAREEPALRLTTTIDDGQRRLQVALDEIALVRVENMAEVVEYRIARGADSTSHVIRFVGGGELRYAFDRRGQVVELQSSGVRASLSAERIMSFALMGAAG
jgi:hypothetical protein